MKKEEMDKELDKICVLEKDIRETKKDLFNLISRLEHVEGNLDEILKTREEIKNLKAGIDGPIIPLEQLFK